MMLLFLVAVISILSISCKKDDPGKTSDKNDTQVVINSDGSITTTTTAADGSTGSITIAIDINGNPTVIGLESKDASGNTITNSNLEGSWAFTIAKNGTNIDFEPKLDKLGNRLIVSQTNNDLLLETVNKNMTGKVAGNYIYFEFEAKKDVTKLIFHGFKIGNQVNGKWKCYDIGGNTACADHGFGDGDNNTFTIAYMGDTSTLIKKIPEANITIDNDYTDWDTIAEPVEYQDISNDVRDWNNNIVNANDSIDIISVKVAQKNSNDEIYFLFEVLGDISTEKTYKIIIGDDWKDIKINNSGAQWEVSAYDVATESLISEISGEASHNEQYLEVKVTGINTLSIPADKFVISPRASGNDYKDFITPEFWVKL